MVAGSGLGFAMQVINYSGKLLQATTPSPESSQFAIVSSGPTLNPSFVGVIMVLGMLGGLVFSIGLVGFAIRLRNERGDT